MTRCPGSAERTQPQGLLATQPAVRDLMVSGSLRAGVVDEAAAAGAAGFLVKGDAGALIAAVRTVPGGGSAWPEDFGIGHGGGRTALGVEDGLHVLNRTTLAGGLHPAHSPKSMSA